MAKEKPSKSEDAESREVQKERLKHLLHDRSEDAAKMVKTWLQQAEEKRK
jgi:flagellar biosynthesis/type III secretory pathway M-ring protein FliF/YscJ